ncbi:DUF2341 domain-containing protein [Sulfurirhabdus autotrophica]|uniref:Outer membrane transport energization protein ExbB n=1 Tax=Sulfurirhabdus autotrophica TaxID=1706046 RepID=A0A4R3YF46_9PROT|nr:DUF2341 domain-containing protein [Sulfurirhabdus autotrophica]TCV89524.1 outer membrane transport energization protein ExbB [Sulfurirhabdus autotrophica]
MKLNILIKKRIISCLAIALLLPTLAQAKWSNDWASRTQVKLDTTQTGADIKQSLDQVPVLVRLHTGNFPFANAKVDGSDIRFVAGDDKTPLKFHIEKFDPLNELALIWVNLPKVAGASKADSFWMYYGNEKATVSDDKGIYDVNQLAVLHFEDKNGFKDATAYGNPITSQGVTMQSGSVIGSSASFNGKSKIVITGTPANSISADKGFTFMTWVKVNAPKEVGSKAGVKEEAAKDEVLFSRQGSAGGIEIGMDASGLYVSLKSAKPVEVKSNVLIAPGVWHHIAVTVSNAVTIYVDGKQVASEPAAMVALDGDMVMGATASGEHFFQGELDEVQILNGARSAEWIKAEALSQGQDAKMISFAEGEEEGAETESASYFGTILHSVTLDGWVVIGILMVMAVISWIVMIGKGMIINRMSADNAKFTDSFKKLARDPGALDVDESNKSEFSHSLFGSHGDFKNSPIFRIYHVGVQEIKNRFGSTDPAKLHGETLSPQAIDAIRASLDATLIRENQRLNSKMVLLTIAISGGPFLGLLGTVVGVMITFAAIAASGDVNVNAIAPGIAAALVATVAGLGVAIPALFGYNYLGSQIKDITADMHVFVDEFISKVAEHYHA